jgi:signal transduction histidine kinase
LVWKQGEEAGYFAFSSKHNMARSALARIPAGGFSVLLGGALLLMVGGLVASHRAVARSATAQTRIDAEQSAQALVLAVEAHGRAGGTIETIATDSTIRSTLAHAPVERAASAIVAGRDTIVVVGDRSAFGRGLTHAVPLAIGASQPWSFVVAHGAGSNYLRLSLWALSLAIATFLGLAVIRERRQAIRVSQRTAELERLYSEVARANTAKSEFLANISHELRTPLNAIVGFVELLKDGVYGDLSPRQIPPVDRIAASATHLRHLVDQVLDIAKIAAGRLEVHPETLVLRAFVLNVASELESLVNERGLSFSIAVGASLPRVRTDPTHLRQILVNLIGNAVKYTPTGGIVVRARLVAATSSARTTGSRRQPMESAEMRNGSPDERRTWIALQVVDTGVGISAADHARIFEEFEQVNAGPRGESMQRGTGLGLAISRRLAQLLDGEIAVVSELGKGSTFTLWLPVHPADLTPGLSATQNVADATR